MASCILTPSVKNPSTGTLTESVLYKDILKYSNNNRSIANKVYATTATNSFNENFRGDKDDNGEAKVESLLSLYNREEIIPDAIMNNSLARDLGETHGPEIKTHTSSYKAHRELGKKAVKFNTSNKFRIAYTASFELADGGSRIKFHRNSEAPITKGKIKANEELYERLEKILNRAGIGISVLEALDNYNIAGYVDFTTAERGANNLLNVIKLLKGEQGIEALPEEFSHVMLEMLGKDNPLVNRLYTALKSNPALVHALLGDSYNSYQEVHNNNEDLLIKEAAAKALALTLQGAYNQQITPLVNRVLNNLATHFAQISEAEIMKALEDIGSVTEELAENLLDGTLLGELKFQNVELKERLYQIKEDIDVAEETLRSLVEASAKRDKIIKSKNLSKKHEGRFDKLLGFYTKGDNIEGITYYMRSIAYEVEKANEGLEADSFNNLPLNEKFHRVHTALQILKAVKFSMEILNDARVKDPNLFSPELKSINRSLEGIVGIFEKQVLNLSRSLSIEKITEYKADLGDLSKIQVGRGDDTTYTLEDIIKGNPWDITFFEKWTSAAASSSDPFLRIMDRIIKIHKEKIRQEFLKKVNELQSLGIKAEKEGITDWTFMYRRDAKGNILPELIVPGDLAKLHEDLKGYDQNVVEAEYKKRTEMFHGVEIPNRKMYPNPEFERLTPTQQKYLALYLKAKNEFDSMLPRNVNTTNPVFIRKNMMDRITTQGVMGVLKGVKDSFTHTIQDVDQVDFDKVLLDFSGVPILSVPLNYVSIAPGETMADYDTTDAIGGLIAYAYMAINNKEMNDLVDFVEVSRNVADNRIIFQENTLEEVLHKGIKFVRMARQKEKISNFLERYHNFVETNVYGVGTRRFKVKGVDLTKGMNNLAALNAVSTMSLNTLNSVSNVLNGLLQSHIEGAASEHFSTKDLIKADMIFTSNSGGIIADVGRRTKQNKVSLAVRLFNAAQEYSPDEKYKTFNKDRWLQSFVSGHTLSVGNTAGEYYLHTRTMLALFNRIKLKDSNGKEVSLWDALKVKEVAPGVKDVVLSSKEKYTTEEGVVLDSEEAISNYIKDLSYKINALNQLMYGIYNSLDKSMLQSYAGGVAVLMYRKWIKSSLDKRYKGRYYNMDLKQEVEGYYRPLGALVWGQLKGLLNMQYTLSRDFNKLTDKQKIGMIRAVVEIAVMFVLMGLAKFYYDDDDTPYAQRSYADKFGEYLVRRLINEMEMFVPSFGTISAFEKLLGSPIPMMTTIEKMFNLGAHMVNPFSYESFAGKDALLKSGRYKGWSRAEKAWFESPLTLFVPNIYKAYHIEDQIDFFKRDH